MKRVIDEIIEFVYSLDLENLRISRACIGAIYSGVVLSNGYGGVSWIIREKLHIHPIDEAGFLDKINIKRDLERFIFSKNPFERSFGFAILNALISSTLKDNVMKGDALDAISIKEGDTITLIGSIGPFIKKFEMMNVKLNLFEKGEVREDFTKYLRKEEELEDIVKITDILILTGVTVENFSIDEIISIPTKAREKILSGPSTPMLKEVFEKRGFTLVAGIRIVDPEMMIKSVSQGGGTKAIIKNSAEKIFLRLK